MLYICSVYTICVLYNTESACCFVMPMSNGTSFCIAHEESQACYKHEHEESLIERDNTLSGWSMLKSSLEVANVQVKPEASTKASPGVSGVHTWCAISSAVVDGY